MSLGDHVIAVAGAGGSLGPTVVARLGEEGARVAGADTDASRLDGLDLADAAGVDLLDPDGAREWADGIAERVGAPTGLIHLVGGWRGGEPIGEFPLEDWALLHDLLIRTVQHTTRAFVEHLRAAGADGRFVLVSAKQAQRPTSKNAAYAAAKAAAEAWTLALADELAPSGATANIIVVNAIGDAKPSFTPPAQIADAIAFLCSDSGQKMNGQRLSLHAP